MKQIRSIVAPANLAVLCLAVVFLSAPPFSAQSVTQDSGTAAGGEISFEVASIKKHVPDPSHFFFFGNPAGDISRWTATNVTARNLIGVAYGLNGYQMTGGPSWI